MVQRGLPTPYNLKPKSKHGYLTTPMKKLLTYLVILIVIGFVVFKAVPDKNQEIEIQLDKDLKKQSTKLVNNINPGAKSADDVTEDLVNSNELQQKKMVADLDKLKEDLKKIGKEEQKGK